MWDLTLLIEVFKFINSVQDYTSVESFYNIIEFLKSNNLIDIDSINDTVRVFDKIEINILKFFKTIYEKKKNSLEDYSKSSLCDYMKKSLCEVDFNESKNYLIIDGLDDVLRYEKSKVEMLSGLFRSINYLNNYFYNNSISIKIIILAREDILASITDPDFNKIERDGGVRLDWNNSYDLMKIVNLRFLLSGSENNAFDNHWNKIFPKQVGRKDSFFYVLQHTLNKPRDILQFLEQCKKEFPNEKTLSISQLKYVMEQYSTFYFFAEMKNELSGFVDDYDIDQLELVFSHIGPIDFTYNKFVSSASKYFSNKNDEYLRKTFNVLFDNGYIGQVITTPSYNKKTKRQTFNTQVVFKHKSPTTKINLVNKFTLHRGLYKAFNLHK